MKCSDYGPYVLIIEMTLGHKLTIQTIILYMLFLNFWSESEELLGDYAVVISDELIKNFPFISAFCRIPKVPNGVTTQFLAPVIKVAEFVLIFPCNTAVAIEMQKQSGWALKASCFLYTLLVLVRYYCFKIFPLKDSHSNNGRYK